jgi:sugar phosphate isomerase/epimerase
MKCNDKDILIGVQAYTVREDFKKDPEDTLKRIRKIGYEGFECDSCHNLYEANRIKEALEQADLKCCGHLVNWKDVQSDTLEKTLRYNEELGNYDIAVAAVNTSLTYEIESLKKVIAHFNKLCDELKNTRFSIGYHSHSIDFFEVDGKTVWDHIFDNTPQEFNMVLDTGNALAGGAWSIPLIKKYPGRQPWVHIKPYSHKNYFQTGYDSMIGEDDFDWPLLLKTFIEIGKTKVFTIEFGNRAKYQPFYGATLCFERLKGILGNLYD